jgi:arylsulfatase A-like enzyme
MIFNNTYKFCVVLALLCVAQVALAAKKPNVILIITDDQSWDTLGFAGGKVHTPRIDKMAAEGLFFSDFNVTSTVCSPARYSFLTGRYAGNSRGETFMA